MRLWNMRSDAPVEAAGATLRSVTARCNYVNSKVPDACSVTHCGSKIHDFETTNLAVLVSMKLR